MSQKTYLPAGETPPDSHIGATFEALAATIAERRRAGEESYTYRLLSGSVDDVLKKVMEEAGEVALAAKDVESWACSSLAAALAIEGDSGNAVCGSEMTGVSSSRSAGEASCGSEAASITSKDAACASDALGTACGSDAGVAASKEAPSKASLGVELPTEYFDAVNHLRYEAADVVYHLLVVLERFGIDLDEFAAELNNRMTDEERPQGGVRLHDAHVKRGK